MRTLLPAALVALIAVGSPAARSQHPTPSPSEGSQPPQDEASQPQQPPAPDQRGTEQQPLFVQQVYPPRNEAEANAEREKQEDKSATEWRLTTYTGLLAVFTFLLFIAAAVQVGLFFRQLRLIRRSLADAKTAADAAAVGARAAQDSATLSRQALETLERPWIFVEINPKLHRLEFPTEIIYAVFDIVNHGRVPAIIEVCHVGLLPGLPGGPEVPILDDRWHGPLGPAGRMQACRATFSTNGIEDSVIIDFATGGGEVDLRSVPRPPAGQNWFFYAKIGYADPFGNQRESSFCWRFDLGMGYWVKYGGKEYNYTT